MVLLIFKEATMSSFKDQIFLNKINSVLISLNLSLFVVIQDFTSDIQFSVIEIKMQVFQEFHVCIAVNHQHRNDK